MDLTVDPDIFDAVEFGDIDTVKMYWTEHIDINWQDALGRNLIMLAAYYGDEEIVRFLLTKQPDLTLKNNDGMTAMDIAISRNQEVIYQLLNNFNDITWLTCFKNKSTRRISSVLCSFGLGF